MVGFPHEVKIVHTTRVKEKQEIIFFYGKMATLGWDPDWWQWVEGYQFFNYTTKFGRMWVITRNLGINRGADKWQGNPQGTYMFYWSWVWDPTCSGNNVALILSIWHKAITVNEWRACIALASISKQHVRS